MVMALIVATFDVSKPMDGEVEVEFDNAVFRCVIRFVCGWDVLCLCERERQC